MEGYILSKSSSIVSLIVVCLLFAVIGIYYSKKFTGFNNYLTANRNVGFVSLTTSLVASALGAWILFGPSSAATWGGIGAVIGYSLGTAFPMFFLIFLGKKIRNENKEGSSLVEFIRKKFQKSFFKFILILTIFYLFIFLCAEVTAISILLNYLSGIDLWITASCILFFTLIYTLYGGLRVSIITDNFQLIIIIIFLLIAFTSIILNNSGNLGLDFVSSNNKHLLSTSYLNNYTAGLTFFIAVAATNLFHQGNWQRVYAAKNNKILHKSLIVSGLIIIPIVFFMGYAGLISKSLNSDVSPDLSFFNLLLSNQNEFLALLVIVLGLSLTISTVDTLINALSSSIIVDGKFFHKLTVSKSLNYSKYLIVIMSLIVFFISSRGYSVLYLFLLADLLCCCFVLTVFYSFYNKSLKLKNMYLSVIIGLIFGILFFPSMDFSKSILVGILLPIEAFPDFIANSLLFTSFMLATLTPILAWKMK